MVNIGLLGCGNMAFALFKNAHTFTPKIKLHTFTPSYTKAKELADLTNGIAYKELNSMPKMDYWIVACKPQQLDELAKTSAAILKEKKIISLLAATPIEALKRKLGSDQIIRIMPNTPSEFSQGIELALFSDAVKNEDRKFILDLFSNHGLVIETKDEKQFDNLTVISGSGPAYVFRFIQSYINKAIEFGLDPKEAKAFCAQLFYGSSLLLKNTDIDIQAMIDAVTSKGGVTIEAINKINESDFDQIVDDSLGAALTRSEEITQLFK